MLYYYAIRGVQVNQDGWKLNGTHQLPVYADIVGILGGSVHTMKKNRGLLPASKETGLEVNADKPKYIVMSRDQKAGQNQNMTHNKISERREHFKFWEKR